MTVRERSYRYVGPPELKSMVRPDGEGQKVCSLADFDAWATTRSADEWAEPFTFVIDTEGALCLAPRRSEHVACAGGGRVLSAGEIGFVRQGDRWAVHEVSNQSTGYCPDVDSWPAVAVALDRIGLERPGTFTYEFVFRRCTRCQERNIVREGEFVCVFCGDDLPEAWNVDPENDGVGTASHPG